MEDTSDSHSEGQTGNQAMQVRLLSLAHPFIMEDISTIHQVFPMSDKEKVERQKDPTQDTQNDEEQSSEEFDTFDDVASKLFQVPIEEVRKLENRNSRNKPQ